MCAYYLFIFCIFCLLFRHKASTTGLDVVRIRLKERKGIVVAASEGLTHQTHKSGGKNGGKRLIFLS